MENNNEEITCPHCSEMWDGYECINCGFADDLSTDEYETPEGNIAHCSEEEAFEQGYIFICPVCTFNVIKWWEKQDHGMCIECWHKRNILTE